MPKPSLLWEFGHLFWRPLGYGLWRLSAPLTASFFHGNAVTEIEAVLFALNFVGGLASAWLVFAISCKLGLRSMLAFAASVAVVLSSAVLNYMHSGTSYVPGLALHLAGLYFILRAGEDKGRRRGYAIAAGVFLALACDVWFLYILAIPAALVAQFVLPDADGDALVSQERMKNRLKLVSLTAGVAAAVGLVSFLMGAVICHISSISELQAWIANSGHGMRADRPLVRFPTGVARTFFYFGRDGEIIKRFVFRDPYAGVHWADLIAAGLWKIALVFVTGCTLVWYLARNPKTRPLLAVLIAAAIPTFGLAFFFETSSPERYLPLFGALLIGACAILQLPAGMRVPRVVLGTFLLGITLVNLNAYAYALRVSANRSSARARLVHEHTRHGGVALIMSFKDPLSTYFHKRPFDPENQQNALPLYHIFEAAKRWKSGSACRVAEAWNAGGEAWLSKRLLAAQPELDWGWIENDDRSVHWSQVTEFFNELQVDSDNGGPDGFVRIARNAKNEAILKQACVVPPR